MDSCDRIRKKLSAYQDGEVETDSKDAIEKHLRACKDCRRYNEALQQTCQSLRYLPDIEADESLSLQILDRVAILKQSPWVRVKDNILQLLPAPTAMVASVVAGILIGLLGGTFWIEQRFFSTRSISASISDPVLTIASVKVFDAAPSGSFAEDYLHLTAFNPEIHNAK